MPSAEACARALELVREPREEFAAFFFSWAAFNALYDEEAGDQEEKISALISNLPPPTAGRALGSAMQAADVIINDPPGDMRKAGRRSFKAFSQRQVAVLRDEGRSDNDRLAALCLLVYRVRCNLLHGSKNPIHERDRVLSGEGAEVIRRVVEIVADA